MKYRLSTLHPSQTYDDDDKTEVIDISVADPISAILITHKTGNNSNDAPTAHALECLTRVELIDGSDVLFSLTGKEADALDWYCNGVQRSNWNVYRNGMDTDRNLGINFGRFLWDPVLALDPKKFTNLQLKFTLDKDAGGCDPDEHTIQVVACLFDEKKVEPTGFLMAKEVKEFAGTSTATHDYTDMPTDHVYRKLLIKAQYPGSEPEALLQNLKLSEDQDKRVVFNHGINLIQAAIEQNNPIYAEHILTQCLSTGSYGYCTPASRVFGSAQRWESSVGNGEYAFYDGDGGRFDVTCETGSGSAQVFVQGWNPHGVMEIPFGDQADIEDWYDVSKIGSLRVDITKQAAFTSSMEAQIFLQQMRKYA